MNQHVSMSEDGCQYQSNMESGEEGGWVSVLRLENQGLTRKVDK